MSGMQIELRQADDSTVLAKTLSDEAGQVAFPDIPPGRYMVTASRPGFEPAPVGGLRRARPTKSRRSCSIRSSRSRCRRWRCRARRGQPTACSPSRPATCSRARCSKARRSKATTFRACCRCCPASCAARMGGCASRAASPSQGALQVSSASLIDPSTGDFDLELPGQSVESVEVLSNPFAAEYGRFSSSITQLRTRRGTNDWEFKPGNLMPRFRKSLHWHPRVRAALLHSWSAHSRSILPVAGLPVPLPLHAGSTLPDEPEIKVKSFDSFTRVDSVLSSQHTLGGGLITFPREITSIDDEHVPPAATTPDFGQAGLCDGHRRPPRHRAVARARDDDCGTNFRGRSRHRAAGTMVYAPETQSGAYFNDQERNVRSVQWVEVAQPVARLLRAAARVQVRVGPAAIDVYGVQPEPAARDPAPRRVAGRAHGVWQNARIRTSRAPSSRCSRRIAGAWARA